MLHSPIVLLHCFVELEGLGGTKLYPRKTNVVESILESTCLSVCVSICVQNTSTFVSQTPRTVLLQFYWNFAHTLILYWSFVGRNFKVSTASVWGMIYPWNSEIFFFFQIACFCQSTGVLSSGSYLFQIWAVEDHLDLILLCIEYIFRVRDWMNCFISVKE